jgi:CHAT domain-containing protein/Tfp pilus assembly protein PilF/predicted nucleic acid-binding protein
MRRATIWTCGLALLLPTLCLAEQNDAAKALTAQYKRALELNKQKKHAEAVAVLEPILAHLNRSPELKSPPREEILYWLGVQHYHLRHHDKAEPLYLQALALCEARRGKDSLDTAGVLNSLGSLYRAMKRDKAAAESLRRCLEIREAKLGKDHLLVATTAYELANAHYGMKEFAKAESLFRRSMQTREKLLGKEDLLVARSAHALANTHLELSQNAQAEPLFRAALAIREKKLGPDHLDVASTLNQLGVTLNRLGDSAKAEPVFRRCLEIREKLLPKDDVMVALSLDNLADTYRFLGHGARAIPLYTRALAIREVKQGPEDVSVAYTCSVLGLVYQEQGELARAEELFRRTVAIREKKLGLDAPETATALTNLGTLYRDMGQRQKAEFLFKKGLQIRQKKLGDDHPMVASSLTLLGYLHSGRSEYDKAEELFRRGLAIREKKGKDHIDVADSLHALAVVAMARADYDKAEGYYRRSLSIYEAKLGKEHPWVATSLDHLAGVFHAKGDLPRVEPLYRSALRIRIARLGPDSPPVADSWTQLSAVYRDLGQYDKALEFARRGLEIREKKFGKEHTAVAESLNRLGLISRDKGQRPAARAYLERAAAIYQARLGDEHPRLMDVLNNLALIHQDLDEQDKAEPLLRRVLATREKLLGPNHPMVGQSYNNLAWTLVHQGKTEEAERLFRRCLEIRERRQGPYHPEVAITLGNLAWLAVRTRQTKLALDSFDREMRIIHRHASRVLPTLPEHEQAVYFRKVSWAEQEALTFTLADLSGEDTSSPWRGARAERAAAWLVNSKGMALESLTAATLLARNKHDPQLAKYADRLREVRQQLAKLTVQPPTEGEAKQHEALLNRLRNEERDLMQAYLLRGASAGPGEWLELGKVREALPADAVFINVARYWQNDSFARPGKRLKGERYAAWLTRATGDVRAVDLGPAARIDAAVKAVREKLEGSAKLIREGGEAKAEEALRGPLEELSRLVLRPLLPHAGSSRRWYVSPDSSLWLVPWEILLLGDGKYAVEKHALSYVLSGRDLLPQARYRGETAAPVIVADPDFDLSGKVQARGPRDNKKEEGFRGLSGLLKLGTIRKLPGTRAEAKAVEKSLRSYTRQAPVQYLGKEAREGVVKRTRNPRVLVLSTHGFFLPEQRPTAARPGRDEPEVKPGLRAGQVENPLLRCGLLLAGCNAGAKGSDADDGVLTGLEVVGMDLRGTELVVLSACETGLGEVRNGAGVAGLRQAFRLAGAEAVVSTLWQVPDQHSARLMSHFFAALAKGKGRAEALREAQRKLIEERREESAAAHPFYWAAFTLTGR